MSTSTPKYLKSLRSGRLSRVDTPYTACPAAQPDDQAHWKL